MCIMSWQKRWSKHKKYNIFNAINVAINVAYDVMASLV